MSNINHDMLTRRMTRDRIAIDRWSYLEAVADHHIRVARMAMSLKTVLKMRAIYGPAEHADAMIKTLVEEIEKSHIEAFGVPTTGELEL